ALCTSTSDIHTTTTGLSSSFPQPCRRTLFAMGGRGDTELLGFVAETWQDEGDCRRWVGVIDFFPRRGESAREAKAICASCPVRAQCRDFALREKITHGVWGGMTELERRQVRRQRKISRAG